MAAGVVVDKHRHGLRLNQEAPSLQVCPAMPHRSPLHAAPPLHILPAGPFTTLTEPTSSQIAM